MLASKRGVAASEKERLQASLSASRTHYDN
jgi:hypothetical protein